MIRLQILRYLERDGTLTFYLTLLAISVYCMIGYIYGLTDPDSVDNWLHFVIVLIITHVIIYSAKELFGRIPAIYKGTL